MSYFVVTYHDYIVNPFNTGIDFERHNQMCHLTSKVDPCTERISFYNGRRAITYLFK